MIPHVVMHLFLELVELAHEIDLYRGQHDANRIHTPIKEGVVIRVSSMARRLFTVYRDNRDFFYSIFKVIAINTTSSVNACVYYM